MNLSHFTSEEDKALTNLKSQFRQRQFQIAMGISLQNSCFDEKYMGKHFSTFIYDLYLWKVQTLIEMKDNIIFTKNYSMRRQGC